MSFYTDLLGGLYKMFSNENKPNQNPPAQPLPQTPPKPTITPAKPVIKSAKPLIESQHKHLKKK
jgi:hypothetical protein